MASHNGNRVLSGPPVSARGASGLTRLFAFAQPFFATPTPLIGVQRLVSSIVCLVTLFEELSNGPVSPSMPTYVRYNTNNIIIIIIIIIVPGRANGPPVGGIMANNNTPSFLPTVA
ncbi:hypothetical protein CH63R_13606 [Colletotrichum higginsianum IMI 349063]|uniref:Uncharacterized protein n=1 Tax=Colletotrichum higginsianum (strain IMI 349063) TaxID=759273 RepID=A0A1B7XRJ3_COLHI|nr:hypothetical protein CH63R_13606 [Colletotrichum higginsianum IMI 349063]OBR02380.1 hypothetical protein CH63R_13606 [Colletotrichum higginsianum IMI 349063]